MPLAEEDEVTQTLVLDRFDKPLRVGIAVWAPRRALLGSQSFADHLYGQPGRVVGIPAYRPI